MKLNKLILPAVLLLAIPSCSNSSDPQSKGGVVPNGGTLVTDQDEFDAELGKLVNKFAINLNKDQKIEMNGSFDGFSFDLNSTRFNSKLALSDFDFKFIADKLFLDNKNDIQGEFSVTGSTLTYKVDAVPSDPEVEETHYDKTVDFGELKAYIKNGRYYIDGSLAKPYETIKGLVRFMEPLYDTLAEKEATLKVLEPIAKLLAKADNADVEKALDEYGYKFEVDGFGLANYSKFNKLIQTASNDDVKLAAAGIKKAVKDSLGLSLSDFAELYTYEDGGRALQFNLSEKEILAMVKPEDVENYGLTFSESFIKAAVYFNKDGFPSSLSLAHNIKAVMDADVYVNVIGSPLSLSTVGAFDMLISNNVKEDIAYPKDIGTDYKKLTGLLVKLAPYLI